MFAHLVTNTLFWSGLTTVYMYENGFVSLFNLDNTVFILKNFKIVMLDLKSRF